MILPKIFALLLVPAFVFAGQNQYAAIDEKALAIPAAQAGSVKDIAQYINTNFPADGDRVRAAFIWVASNIQYDIDNLYAINFDDKKEDRELKTFATGKGVCIDYAEIFTDICNLCGVQSYVVGGYNRPDGENSYMAHAWSAALVDNDWYLFDPTWSSGYLRRNKFIKKLNNSFYKMLPSECISSHMPFDPMWECLNYPITNEQFYSSEFNAGQLAGYFSYKDSIKQWAKLSQMAQYASSARRMEQNGVKNAMIHDEIMHLKNIVKFSEDTAVVNNYNRAGIYYSSSIRQFNKFIAYRNEKFEPAQPDSTIQNMLDTAINDLSRSKAILAPLKGNTDQNKELIKTMNNLITDYNDKINEQKEWLAKYFSKNKIARRLMFYK